MTGGRGELSAARIAPPLPRTYLADWSLPLNNLSAGQKYKAPPPFISRGVVAENIFQGSTILALVKTNKPEQSDVRAAKRLLRQAMSLLIGSRPLNSVAAN